RRHTRFSRDWSSDVCSSDLVEVTGAITTETEVVTDFQMLYAEAIDQDLLDELVGTEFAQAAVEGQAQHPVHTLLFQQCQLVTQKIGRASCRERGEHRVGAAA